MSFIQKKEKRLDFGISACGYITVLDDGVCIYKESVCEVKSLMVSTNHGSFVAYKHWKADGNRGFRK